MTEKMTSYRLKSLATRIREIGRALTAEELADSQLHESESGRNSR